MILKISLQKELDIVKSFSPSNFKDMAHLAFFKDIGFSQSPLYVSLSKHRYNCSKQKRTFTLETKKKHNTS